MVNTVYLSIPLTGTDQPNGSPCEILFCGEFDLGDRGVLKITEDMVNQIVENFNALGESGRIPISVNHRTAAGTLEEARAIGWVVDLFKQTQNARISLYMRPKWLDDAKEAIANEHFRFLSAGLMLGNDKRPARLVEVSVTNIPALSGLQPIELSAKHGTGKVAALRQRMALLHSRIDRISCGERTTTLMSEKDATTQFWDLCDQALKDNPKLSPGEARRLVALEHRHLAELAMVPGARRGRKDSQRVENSSYYSDKFFELAQEIEKAEGVTDIVARGRILRAHPGLRDAAFGTDARTRFFGAAKFEVEHGKLDLAQAYRAVSLHLKSDAEVVL